MTAPNYTTPTLSGFIAWTRAVMGVPTVAIPDNDAGYEVSYNVAIDMIPPDIAAVAATINEPPTSKVGVSASFG